MARQELIETYVTEEVLEAVAKEYAKGRLLFMASPNLDAEQPVVWNMGAIAASSSPDRLTLFRKVMLASASIPSMFPPVLMDVTVDGKKYQEMHVDGAVFFQSLSIGSVADLPATVQRALTSISMRAILTMLKVSGINDLWRLYLSTRDDDADFCYVAFPAEYIPSTTEQFNQAEMIPEYDFGRNMAEGGIPWKRSPLGYAEPQNKIVPQ